MYFFDTRPKRQAKADLTDGQKGMLSTGPKVFSKLILQTLTLNFARTFSIILMPEYNRFYFFGISRRMGICRLCLVIMSLLVTLKPDSLYGNQAW